LTSIYKESGHQKNAQFLCTRRGHRHIKTSQ